EGFHRPLDVHGPLGDQRNEGDRPTNREKPRQKRGNRVLTHQLGNVHRSVSLMNVAPEQVYTRRRSTHESSRSSAEDRLPQTTRVAETARHPHGGTRRWRPDGGALGH